MPSSTSVIRKASDPAAILSWHPEALEAEPEYRGRGQPPFFQGAALEETVGTGLPGPLGEGFSPVGSGNSIPFDPIVKKDASGRVETPARWKPLEFKPLETSAQAAGQADAAARSQPVFRSGYKPWKPAELEISAWDSAEPSRSGLAGELLKEAQSAMQSAHEHAVEVLRKAEAQAAQVVAEAEAQAAEIVGRAEDQATEILRQGYSEGMAAANAEMAELLRTVSAIVAEVNAWRDEMFAQGELMMLRLVIEIAQTIFGDGLPLDPEALGAAFSRALSQAKTLGDLRIYVHPDDAIALSPQWAQQQSVICGQQIELIPSEIIKRGGCFIEGQFGAVDSRVESQLKLVEDSLLATQAAAQAAAREFALEDEA